MFENLYSTQKYSQMVKFQVREVSREGIKSSYPAIISPTYTGD